MKGKDSKESLDKASIAIVPKGALLHLKPDQIKPSVNNPRRLFDPEPLKSLKDSIKAHGVLVPLTVFKLAGQELYGIVDGERRYRCCVLLEEEGQEISIPANVVESPDRMASLIYMFNIHNFREQWDLMPTALSLKKVIEDLGDPSDEDLKDLTGMSLPQIKRCRIILTYDQRHQDLSLEDDPKERIPSNFWTELYPVLGIAEEYTPELVTRLGRNRIIDQLVEKYNARNIKSVIHFRRIVEAFQVGEQERKLEEVIQKFEEYVLNPNLETRNVFDYFIMDARRVQKAVEACDSFVSSLERSKVSMTVDIERDELVKKLEEVVLYIQNLMDQLSGEDPRELGLFDIDDD